MHPHELLILRHGQTEWNVAGRWQGRRNSPLTEEGRRQALRQRAILEGMDLSGHLALTSPQGRAVETAGLAVAPLVERVASDARLMEIDVGDWGGLRPTDISPDAGDMFGPASLDLIAEAPGGEGFAALRARCTALLAALEGPAVLVTHGVTSRMLRAVAMGRGDDALAAFPGGQGVVHRIAQGRAERLE